MQLQSRAIIMARVSSKAQVDEGYSLDSQIKLLREYCENKSLRIIKEFKITETASKQERRTVFNEMLLYVTKTKINHFVVEKTDRLTRNLRDAAYIDDWLEGDDQRVLHVVKEGQHLHKGSRSDAKFMWSINIALAKKYTDNLREEAMKGWAEKLAQGWIPSPPPPGYLTITENGKRIHVPNPATRSLMQRAFELALTPSHSGSSVAREMTAMGLVTSKGRPFSKSSVYKILTNPFYIGINRFDGKEYPGAQEPIISRKLFEAVQVKLRRKGTRARKHNPVFKGMLYCIECGKAVTWQLQKGWYYGSCQRNKPACQGKALLREDWLERRIVGMLEGLRDPHSKVLAMLESSIQVIQPHLIETHRNAIIEQLNRQIARLERMCESLYEDKLAGDVSASTYTAKRKHLKIKTDSLRVRLFRLNELKPKQRPTSLEFGTLKPIVRLYVQSTPDEKRIIMTQLFKAMQSGQDGVTIELA